MKNFVLEINGPLTDTGMGFCQEVMDEMNNHLMKEIDRVSVELNIDTKAASDVVYLRTRSRWTQELENRLIAEHKNGRPVNVMEFR